MGYRGGKRDHIPGTKDMMGGGKVEAWTVIVIQEKLKRDVSLLSFKMGNIINVLMIKHLFPHMCIVPQCVGQREGLDF